MRDGCQFDNYEKKKKINYRLHDVTYMICVLVM